MTRSAQRFIPLALVALAPVLGWSQITLVNVTSCGAQNFPAACTIPATGSGHLIVVGFETNVSSTSTTINSITDNMGNAYAEAGSARAVDSSDLTVTDLWYAKNSASGATTLTINPNTTINASAVIWEFAGVDQSAPLDKSGALSNQAATATVAGAPVTLTSSPEVVISIADVGNSVSGMVSGNTFTNDSNLFASGWAHLITSAAGTYSAQWAQSPAGTYASSTASFKAATGGAGTLPPVTASACDINKDGSVNVIDVQLAADNYVSCSNSAFQTFYSQVLSGALASCPASTGVHAVALSWGASSTSGVTYNIYRATTSGGYNYSVPLNAAPLAGTSFSDCGVTVGQTYYYVVRAVDSSGNPSANSPEVTAAIPSV